MAILVLTKQVDFVFAGVVLCSFDEFPLPWQLQNDPPFWKFLLEVNILGYTASDDTERSESAIHLFGKY